MTESSPLFDPSAGIPGGVLATLFHVALDRLVCEGRLVFWLPTRPEAKASDVIQFLNTLSLTTETSAPTTSTTSITSTTSTTSIAGADRGILKDCINDIKNKSINDKVEEMLALRNDKSGTEYVLEVKRVTSECLSDSLWRWLCVLEKKKVIY